MFNTTIRTCILSIAAIALTTLSATAQSPSSLMQHVMIGNSPLIPVALRGLDGEWEKPIMVSHDAKRDIYIPEGVLVANLVYNSQYAENGDFTVVLYTSYKSKSLREDVIRFIGRQGDSFQAPQDFQYIEEWINFDIQNHQALVSRQIVIGKDGRIMGGSTEETQQLVVDIESKKNPYSVIAGKIANILRTSNNNSSIRAAQRNWQGSRNRNEQTQ